MAKVYVGGLYRSGTTFVQKALDAQPTGHVFYQCLHPLLHLVDRRFQARRFPGRPAAPLCFKDMSTDPELPRALDLVQVTADDTQSLVEAARQTANSADDYPDGRFADRLADTLHPGPAREAAAAYFAAGQMVHDAGESDVIGFKEIFADAYLEALLDSFPDLKVIHLLRDPRAVLTSRNYREVRNGQSPQRHPLAMVAAMWVHAASYAEKAAQTHPGRILRLRFEDLMADKDAALARILSFLGLPLSGAVFDERLFTTARGTPWRGNSAFSEGPAPSLDRWTALLPPEALGALEYLCGARLEAEGYRPHLPAKEAERLFAAYTDSIETLKPWTRPFALKPNHSGG